MKFRKIIILNFVKFTIYYIQVMFDKYFLKNTTNFIVKYLKLKR